MSVVTAHMVYFCAFARSEIFQKNARKSGVGRGQFDAGVNGLNLESRKMSNSCVRKLFDQGDKLITSPKLILSELYDFYTELYSNRDSPNYNDASDAFLDHCRLPALNEDA